MNFVFSMENPCPFKVFQGRELTDRNIVYNSKIFSKLNDVFLLKANDPMKDINEAVVEFPPPYRNTIVYNIINYVN